MAIKKTKVAKGNDNTAMSDGANTTATPPPTSAPDLFPYARFTSVTGVHTSLLAFTALFLPRTSFSLSLLTGQQEPVNDQLGASDRALRLLTENPLRTVAWICAGAVVLQAWWAGWLRSWAVEEAAGVKAKRNTVEERLHPKKRFPSWVVPFKGAAVATFAASVALHIILILFGAPIASRPVETYSLSLLLALLTTFTPAYVLGSPSLEATSEALVVRLTWIRLFAELSPRNLIERAMVYPAMGALLGCWAGAIPIGLDWERPWQAWPLTPAYGALSGYILGSLGTLAVTAIKELARADISMARVAAVKAVAEENKAKAKKRK